MSLDANTSLLDEAGSAGSPKSARGYSSDPDGRRSPQRGMLRHSDEAAGGLREWATHENAETSAVIRKITTETAGKDGMRSMDRVLKVGGLDGSGRPIDGDMNV